MKAAIVCYSFSGNTLRACYSLLRKFQAKGIDPDLIGLKPKGEARSFFKQGVQAFFKDRVELTEVNSDLAKYELIIFASPVWAFTFAPALRAYLEKIINLEGKKVGCFLTYGSGLGRVKARAELENIIREKNGRIVFSKDLSGSKTKDDACLEEVFKPLFDILNIK
jgi:flavodoxin